MLDNYDINDLLELIAFCDKKMAAFGVEQPYLDTREAAARKIREKEQAMIIEQFELSRARKNK